MRRIRYQVASSLDGFIAGPNGEADWIVMDPEIDFTALFAQFDTLVMGRKTYEAMKGFGSPATPDQKVYVVSRTLRQEECKGVTVVAEPKEAVQSLRKAEGKDIWLFGGGELFRSLAEAGLVDTVEVAVMPVMLGGGIPLLPSPSKHIRLKLENHRLYQKSGIMLLEYEIVRKSK